MNSATKEGKTESNHAKEARVSVSETGKASVSVLSILKSAKVQSQVKLAKEFAVRQATKK